MKKLFFITLAAAFIACQPKPSENTEVVESNPLEINCDGIGPIKMAFTHADVIASVGQEKVVDTVFNVDGNNVNVSIVNPDEPEEILVYWNENEAPFNTISELKIRQAYSPYALANGLKIGSSLEDLRTHNNFQPIIMTNFYNNLDGYAEVKSFSSGDLGTSFPCLNLKLDIVRQKGLDVGIRDAAKEQEELKSSDRIFSMLEVVIHDISIKR